LRKPGLPLTTLPEFAGEPSRKPAEFNITTGEEFASLTNTEDVRHRVAEVLGFDDASVENLRRTSLSPEDVGKEMERPAGTSMFGLGAWEPKKDE